MAEDVRKVVGYIPVSREIMAEGARYRRIGSELLDRYVNPWRYPDASWAQRVQWRLFPPPIDRILRWWDERGVK